MFYTKTYYNNSCYFLKKIMKIHKYTLWNLQSNSYLVESNEWNYIIDLGWEDFEKMLDYINQHKLKINGIILTHGHFDHIIWVNKFLEITNLDIPVYIWAKEIDFLYKPQLNLSWLWWDKSFILNEEITIKSLENWDRIWPFEVIHTPGHTIWSICLLDSENKLLFSGDTIFQNWYWRTDLPTWSEAQLIQSLNLLNKYIIAGYEILDWH